MVNLRHVSGPLLLIIPLVLTGTIGIFYNNFQNNGLVTPTVATFTGCPTVIAWNSPNNNAQAEICQAFNQTYIDPCQSAQNATYCGFQTPKILNPNSIYTCILDVSWQCFVGSITGANSGPAPQPFAFFNQPQPPIYNICLNINGTFPGAGSTPDSIFGAQLQCDQVDQNSHKVQANESVEYNSFYNCQNISPAGYGGNYVYFGCDWNNAVSLPPTNSTWSVIEAFNASEYGSSGNGWVGCTENSGGFLANCDVLAYALIYNQNSTDTTPLFDWALCPYEITNQFTANTTITPACHAGYTASQQENGGTTGGQLFFFSQILALIGGIILTLIGFGLGFSGGALTFNFSVTPNSQGTRYAQILGFALLIIVPFDSEFTGPFTLLSIFGIGSIILTIFALFEFMGIFLMVAQPAVSQ